MSDEIDLSSHLEQRKPAAPPPEPVPDANLEDSGSRALSEALRSSFLVVKFVMVLLIIVFFASGIFIVGPQENAIILRLGKPLGTGERLVRGPGLHWSFPRPIDEVVRIPTKELQTVTSSIGWYQTTLAQEQANLEPPPGPSLNPAVDGYTLTGDGNIIHVRATLRYRIKNPLRYSLEFASASNVVKSALDNALVFVSAQYSVDNALRLDLAGFREKVLGRVERAATEHHLGIALESRDLTLSLIPPRQVNEAFERVQGAEQERRKTINDAIGYANQLRSRAEGEAGAIINAGHTDRNRLVASIAAEAQSFSSQLPYYRQNANLFVQRLQTETLHRILTNSQNDKFFLPQGMNGKAPQLRIDLNREPARPATNAPGPL